MSSHVNRNNVVENYTESFSYDAFGSRLSHLNKVGETFDYEYDALGRMTQMTSPQVTVVDAETGSASNQRIVTEYRYDAFGNQTQVTEAKGLAQQRTTLTHYDAIDRAVGTDHPAFTVYDPVTDSSNQVTPQSHKIYDVIGNLTETIDVSGAHSYFYYDAAGNITRDRSYNERVTGLSGSVPPVPTNLTDYRENTHRYDANNLRVETSSQEEVFFNLSVGLGFDLPQTATSSYVYDASGNLVKETDPRGYSSYSYYDGAGNLTLQVDADGYLTEQTYNHEGQITRITRYAAALGSTTLAALSVASNPQTLIAEVADDSGLADKNRSSVYEYDALGREVIERQLDVTYSNVDSGTGVITQVTANLETETGYDGSDRTLYVVDGNGDRQDYIYDALGRQTQQMGAVFNAFANFDNDTETTVSTRETTMLGYDAGGNLVRQTRLALAGGDAQVSGAVYNSAGFAIASIDGVGHRVEYDLDSAGRTLRQRETVTDIDGLDTEIHTNFSYDVMSREISRQQVEAPGTVSEKAYTSTDVRYNAHGDIEAEGKNGQFQTQYFYDKLGRILKSNKDNGSWRVYAYDKSGNSTIEALSLSIDLGYITSAAQIATFNPQDVQLTYSVYDARNNLTDMVQ